MATARKVAQQAVRARRVLRPLRIDVQICEPQDDRFATIVKQIQADRCRQRQFVLLLLHLPHQSFASQIVQFEIIEWDFKGTRKLYSVPAGRCAYHELFCRVVLAEAATSMRTPTMDTPQGLSTCWRCCLYKFSA